MSDQQEFYAATVEQALDRASKTLGVARDKLNFEVLDEGSTGFLGIGTRDARILIRGSETQENTVLASRNNGVQFEAPEEEQQVPSAETRQGTEHLMEETVTSPALEAPHSLILAVDEFMTALIDAMGLDATVDAHDAGDAVVVDVATEQTGLFIGQKGETIDAIQYLLNVAVYKDRPFVKRIVVDSEGYRQRRVEAIQGMAHRTARRAVRERRPLSLPPMSAAERRIVHLFLKENPKVTTSSDGKDENRRVVVSPA